MALRSPRPGALMEIRGVPDETERVNLIAYLRTFSDKPLPAIVID
jgi:cytochrome c